MVTKRTNYCWKSPETKKDPIGRKESARFGQSSTLEIEADSPQYSTIRSYLIYPQDLMGELENSAFTFFVTHPYGNWKALLWYGPLRSFS